MATKVNQLPIDVRTAAEYLGIDQDAVRGLIKAAVLSAVRPHGAGVGKPIYVLPDEIQAYKAGGVDAVSALRAAKKGA